MMIFGSNLLCRRLTVIIFLSPLVHSQKLDQDIANKSSYFQNMSRMINGIKARPGQFPYQVSIRNAIPIPDVHECGGAIVAGWWVLTAAHCIDFYDHTMMKIVAGTTKSFDYRQETHVRGPRRLIQHHNWKNNELPKFKIGLIQVDRRWNFDTPYVKPLKYFFDKVPVNTSCFVAGWGVKAQSGKRLAEDLLYNHEYFYENYFCNTKVLRGGKFSYTKETICAGNLARNSGPCYKDEGSPLVCNGYLEGIFVGTPSGAMCDGRKGIPNVYVNARYYYSWILSQWRKNNGKALSPSGKSISNFVRTSKTHTLHMASDTFRMVNLMFMLYCVIVYV